MDTKRGTPKHPKMFALAAALNIDRLTAVGIMEELWHFTAAFTPRGDIGRYSDDHIAGWIGWHGHTSRLMSGLLSSGFLEPSPNFRLIIHDWAEHADGTVRKYLERHKLEFITSSTQNVSTESGHSLDKVSRHSPSSRATSLALPCLKTETVKQETFPTTEQASVCGNVENSAENPNSGIGAGQTPDATRRKPVLPPEQYLAQHPPMNESMFSKLLDSKDLNHFQNEIPKPSKPPANTPDYLLSCEEQQQPRNGSSKPREVVQIPVHPATELERIERRLSELPTDSPECEALRCEIVKKKASIEMKTKELERKLR